MHYNPGALVTKNNKQYSWNKINSKVKANVINLVWDYVWEPVWHNTTLTLTLDFMDSYES